jgi:hypothetical protein
LPSAVTPALEAYANKSWNKTPIEGKYDRQNYPAYLIKDEKTSTFATILGDIAKNTNGISPKQIDYLVRGYTGKVGEFFWRLPDTAKKGYQAPGNITNYPVIKSFIADTAYSSQSITDLYDYGEELSTRLNEFKKTGKYKAMNNLPVEKQKVLFNALEAARSDYNKLADDFVNASKAIDQIAANDKFTPDEKEKRQRQIRTIMNKMAADFNDKYEKFKKNNNIK